MSNVALNNDTCSHGFVQASCTNCNLKGLCLPLAMDVKDIDRLDNIIQRGRPLQSGDHLYRAGDTFTSIYAVRSGSIKTYLIDDDGVEQITGFYLPGEVLGFDGIDNNNYGCNVVALETSTVCEIPFYALGRTFFTNTHFAATFFPIDE